MSEKPVDIGSMFKELQEIYQKYGLPKGMGFVPDRLEITLQRREGDRFELTYSEFFSYLPSEVFSTARENVTQFFEKMGLLPEAIDHLPDGVKVHINGDFRVALFVMLETLLQNRNIKSELPHYMGLIGTYLDIYSDLFSFHWDFEEETRRKWTDYLTILDRVVQENPSISSEIQEVLKKHAGRPV